MAELKSLSGIIVLIGFPGSGKSHLAKNICAQATSKCNLPPQSIKLIQYDEIFNNITQENGLDAFDAILWHKSRVKALAEASSFVSTAANVSSEEPVLLIIDDNMFYRSMRLPFYKLARKHQIGYIQLYLDIPIDICIKRDAQRSEQVLESTILRMQERLETPDASKHEWESNSLSLDVQELESHTTEALLGRIFTSFAHLPPPLCDAASDEMERQNSRERNVKSFGHQLDLQLRKIVSQALSSDLSQAIKKRLGPQIHKVKQQFLDDAMTLYEVEDGETVVDAFGRAALEFSNHLELILQKFG
eukprot:TRINITY_DN15402_c0_g1_i1.p1 TRINITY_DN15402_c0_g1~~TRINITY_DN15402_c0_g1_i1.p1  ORF type:complete len:313 (-),score=36.88 TRINITY_DN15402_c0_g1_i1:63-974(-)